MYLCIMRFRTLTASATSLAFISNKFLACFLKCCHLVSISELFKLKLTAASGYLSQSLCSMKYPLTISHGIYTSVLKYLYNFHFSLPYLFIFWLELSPKFFKSLDEDAFLKLLQVHYYELI